MVTHKPFGGRGRIKHDRYKFEASMIYMEFKSSQGYKARVCCKNIARKVKLISSASIPIRTYYFSWDVAQYRMLAYYSASLQHWGKTFLIPFLLLFMQV